MKTLSLEAQKIETGNAQAIRAESRVPAVVYGKGFENLHLSFDLQDFIRIYRQAGKSMIIEIDVAGEKISTLVQDVQQDPVTDEIAHIDFMVVVKGQEITTDLPIHLTGESEAVKTLHGILMHNKETIAIKCLPRHLIANIEIDISVIQDFHTAITVGDLKLPTGITVLDNPEVQIVSVSAPKIEKEVDEIVESEEEGAEEEKKEEDTNAEEKSE